MKSDLIEVWAEVHQLNNKHVRYSDLDYIILTFQVSKGPTTKFGPGAEQETEFLAMRYRKMQG